MSRELRGAPLAAAGGGIGAESAKLLDQFTGCLESTLVGERTAGVAAGPPPDAASHGATPADVAPADVAPLDLGSVARAAVLKRAIPAAVVVAVVVAVIVWLANR